MRGDYGNKGTVAENRLFYGWVVVAVSMVLAAAVSAIVGSFGVFFKPLAANFGWNRATTSGIQSLFLVSSGVFAVAAGWLTDRFGPARVLVMCGTCTGLGLVLTSHVSALWQIYLTYSLMTAIGISSGFTIACTVTAGWFPVRRGLALGIVTSGVGLGNLVGGPTIAYLIEAFGWSRAYLVFGLTTGMILVSGACFLRHSPEQMAFQLHDSEAGPKDRISGSAKEAGDNNSAALLVAIRGKTLWLLFSVFFLFTFCNQMVMTHLVNYATDAGITPLLAATLVSGLGLSGMTGRLLMGFASDRIGSINVLILACLGMVPALVLLIYARELWMLYIFTMIYGFSYGAEVPQQAALIGRFFGLRAVLVGILQSASNIGGALGSWLGGKVYDVTRSYQIAFLVAGAAIVSALVITIVSIRCKPDRLCATNPDNLRVTDRNEFYS